MSWQSYRGAPQVGARVCSVEDIPQGGALCLELDGFPLLLVRIDGRVQAYVNACPHQYLPLNHKSERLISADKKILRCSNHSAGFSVESGEGVEGLGLGTCLDPVPMREDGGDLLIGD